MNQPAGAAPTSSAASTSAASTSSQHSSPLARVGGRLTRDTLIYGLGTLAVGPFSLISVAVLTRVLIPAAYGRLGVLLVFAGFLTVAYNTGSLHGTFMWVYGQSDEAEVDSSDPSAAIASTPRRAMGTGVVLTLLIVGAGTTIVFFAAEPLAELILGSARYASSVRWAAASAATGALWRLTVNVFRMERRPISFSVLNSTRPLFVLAGTLPLVLLGLGINGALAGITLGTLVASFVCMLLARRSYAFAFSLSDARHIVRMGARVVVPVTCLYFLHSADILLLSRFTNQHELGLYRVASRFGAAPSYFSSSLLMAWAPLEAGLLFRSVFAQRGEHETRSLLLTYYLIAGATLVLLLDVGANALMLIAGRSYRSAAPLIPAVGAMFVFYGLYVVLVRAMRTRRTMLLYGTGSLIAVALDCGFSVLLIPRIGAYGAPAAALLGLAIVCVLYVVAVSRMEELRFPFEWRRLRALAVAVGTAAAIQLTLDATLPGAHVLALTLAVIVYGGLLVALGAMPLEEARRLGRLLAAVMRNRIGPSDATERLGTLSAAERRLLTEFERDRTSPLLIATRERRPQHEVVIDYVAIVRKLARAGPPHGELEERIGAYLLSREPHAQRDRFARGVVQDGADPAELLLLDDAVQKLRALSTSDWTQWTSDEQSTPRHSVERVRAVLGGMPPASRRAAIAVLRDGRAAVEAAAHAGESSELIAARIVRALRHIGDLGRGEPFDGQLGLALLGSTPAPRTNDDEHAVGMVYDRLRGMRARHWRLATALLETGTATVGEPRSPRVEDRVSPQADGQASPHLSIGRRRPAALLATGLLLCGVVLMVLSRHLSFYADEWEFIVNRRGWNVEAFLRPHNEHLMLVPVAVFKLLFVTVGLHHSWPYRLVLIAVHLLCVSLIYIFAARRAGRWPALALAALILIPGAAFEDLVYPINLGFVGCCAAGVGALLCLDRKSKGGDVGACALLGVSLASTSLGIPIALGVLAELVLHREHRRRLWVALAPLALYGLWYLHWGSSAHSEVSLSNLPSIPSYSAEAAAYGFAGIVNLSLGFGQIALVAAVAWLIVRYLRGRPLPAWGLAGLLAGIGFWSLAALGRAQLDSPGSSRYVYPSIFFILVVAAAHMRRPARITQRAGALVAVGLAAMFLSNLGPLINYASYRTRYDRTYDARLGAEMIAALPNDPYVQALDQLGSPALSDHQILALDSEDRAAADELLLKIEQPQHRLQRISESTVRALAHIPSLEGAQGVAVETVPAFAAGSTAKCLSIRPLAGGGTAEVAVAPGAGLFLSMYDGGEVGIQLRRLSETFTTPPLHGFAHRSGPAALWLPADRSKLPWYVQLTPTARVEICLL